MGVTHCHCKAFVPQEFFHFVQIHAVLDEPGGKRVAQIVKVEVSNLPFLHGRLERNPKTPLGDRKDPSRDFLTLISRSVSVSAADIDIPRLAVTA